MFSGDDAGCSLPVPRFTLKVESLNFMNRRLFALLFLLVWTAAALAQFGSNSSSQPGVKLRGQSFAELYAAQKVLLSNYCRLDFEGARLQPAGWNRFKPYTSLRTNPEFTRVIIVTRFNIEAPEQPSEELSANYQTVGSYREGEGYTSASFSDQVTFRMQEQNGNLLVTEVHPETPHVSPRAALAWMTLRLADPKTSELERALLKDAVQQLNKSLPQPRPATNPPGA
jgi:hypothetical protein